MRGEASRIINKQIFLLTLWGVLKGFEVIKRVKNSLKRRSK